jgi:hypothetical protein
VSLGALRLHAIEARELMTMLQVFWTHGGAKNTNDATQADDTARMQAIQRRDELFPRARRMRPRASPGTGAEMEKVEEVEVASSRGIARFGQASCKRCKADLDAPL